MRKTLLGTLCVAGLVLGTANASAGVLPERVTVPPGLGATSIPDYQDWWWDPAQSGMGVNIGHQADTLVMAWYLFDSDGKGMYMMLSGPLENNQLTGTLYRSAGPAPGPGYDPILVERTPVGTATLAFSSVREGTLTYEYEGRSGSLALQRYVFEGPADVSLGVMVGQISETGCSNPAAQFVPVAQDNQVIQVQVTEVRDGIYNLQLLFHSGVDYWQCNTESMALTLDKGVWRGTANTACQGVIPAGEVAMLPPLVMSSGALNISALRLNGNNSFFDWSIDFSAVAGKACTVSGGFRGFSVTLDD